MTCQARRGPDGQTHCAACRTVCDADDEMPCPLDALEPAPRTVPERSGFVSGLAPDYFARPRV